MKEHVYGIGCAVAAVFLLCSPTAGQAPRIAEPSAVVEKLFAAMKASDTAAVRVLFTGKARVIPIQPGAPSENAGQGLTVDQFVAFVGRSAPGNWVERMLSPSLRISGPLADLWFDYDVHRGTVFDHCGVNSVQLQDTGGGWKIVSMAFTSVTEGCAKGLE